MPSPTPEMLTVDEAEKAVREAMPRYGNVTVEAAHALGRILREPIRSDRAQPPFDRVAMDGIAIGSAAWRQGRRRFAVEGMCKAGEPRARLASPEGCLEVMTGCVLPEGCDAVVPVEDLAVEAGEARVRAGAAAPVPWRHVHRLGTDCAAGEIIVPAGTRLAAPHLGAAASFGAGRLAVAHVPSVAVIATGDELVDPETTPETHQLRRSNPQAVAAALRAHGLADAVLSHAPDDPEALRRAVAEALTGAEAIILTGGVSMGKTDYVPSVLQGLGVRVRFHKVKQKPGKPFWFGTTADGKPVFALPGNPASVLVCLYRYVLPALLAAQGGGPSGPGMALLAEAARLQGDVEHFRPVSIQKKDGEGRTIVGFVRNQGSGDFSGWARADGFVELSAGGSFAPGSPVPFFRW